MRYHAEFITSNIEFNAQSKVIEKDGLFPVFYIFDFVSI